MRQAASLLTDWASTLRSPAARRLLFCIFVIDGTFGFLFVVAVQTYFVPQLVAGLSVAGLALALFAAGKLSAQYFASSLTDRLGAKRALECGLIVLLVAIALLLLAAGLPYALAPASFFYGAGSATLWPAVFAWTAGFPARSRSHISSGMTIATGAGLATAVGLGFVLPESFPFSLAGALGFVAVISALLAIAGSSAPVRNRAATDYAAAEGTAWRQPLVLATGCLFFLEASSVSGLVSIFRSFGQDVLDVSFRTEILLLSPACACFGLGVLTAGIAGRTVKRTVLVAFATAIAGTALAAMAEPLGSVSAIALLATAAFGLGVALPATTLVALEAGGLRPGRTFGVVLTFESLGHIFGPAAASRIIDTHEVLAFLGALLLAGSGAALMIERQRQPGEVRLREGEAESA